MDTGYSLIFDDGFDDGDTSRWNLSPDWTVVEENGNWFLRGMPGGGASLASPLVRAEYRFKVDLRIISGMAGLNYRVSRGNRYLLEVTPGRLRLSKEANGEWSEGIAKANVPISTGLWHTVEISGTAGCIQVFVDETLCLDYVDPDPVRAGSISLGVYADNLPAHVDFDNIQVFAPGSESPPGSRPMARPVHLWIPLSFTPQTQIYYMPVD